VLVLAAADGALHDIEPALAMLGGKLERRAGRKLRFGVEQRREHLRGRGHPPGGAGDHAHACGAERERRDRVRRVVLERGLDLLVPRRERHPELQEVRARAAGAQRGRGALGVCDAAAGDHPVERAGPDRLLGAQAVAVQDLALEGPGDGRQADVRVRPHVHALPRPEVDRPEMVEEHEGADHPALGRRQQATHRDSAAQVAPARADHELDRGFGRATALRIQVSELAHRPPFQRPLRSAIMVPE